MALAVETTPQRGASVVALANSVARRAAQATLLSTLADARYQTLQKTPAPISYLDVVYPFPGQLVPSNGVPGLGDAGGYATARPLEDI